MAKKGEALPETHAGMTVQACDKQCDGSKAVWWEKNLSCKESKQAPIKGSV